MHVFLYVSHKLINTIGGKEVCTYLNCIEFICPYIDEDIHRLTSSSEQRRKYIADKILRTARLVNVCCIIIVHVADDMSDLTIWCHGRLQLSMRVSVG